MNTANINFFFEKKVTWNKGLEATTKAEDSLIEYVHSLSQSATWSQEIRSNIRNQIAHCSLLSCASILGVRLYTALSQPCSTIATLENLLDGVAGKMRINFDSRFIRRACIEEFGFSLSVPIDPFSEYFSPEDIVKVSFNASHLAPFILKKATAAKEVEVTNAAKLAGALRLGHVVQIYPASDISVLADASRSSAFVDLFRLFVASIYAKKRYTLYSKSLLLMTSLVHFSECNVDMPGRTLHNALNTIEMQVKNGKGLQTHPNILNTVAKQLTPCGSDEEPPAKRRKCF